MTKTINKRPMIVLRPEWGGVFAWKRNKDGTHDTFGLAASWGGRPKQFIDATGASREIVRDLCAWQSVFEEWIDPAYTPFPRNKDKRVRSLLKLLDARAFDLAKRLKAEIGGDFRIAVAPLCRKWHDQEV